jgi:hypothetical protein
MATTNSSSGKRSRWIDLLAAAALLGLAGCAQFSETQCRAADWGALGQRDGLMGLRPQIEQYAHQCQAANVQVTDAAYMQGWQLGKWEYDSRVHSSDCCGPN